MGASFCDHDLKKRKKKKKFNVQRQKLKKAINIQTSHAIYEWRNQRISLQLVQGLNKLKDKNRLFTFWVGGYTYPLFPFLFLIKNKNECNC